MILGFNLLGLLLLFFPPLFYAWLIYIIAPHKSLSLKNSIKFIIGGIFSVVILDFILFLTPYWDLTYTYNSFLQQFFITAPKEEISKFFMFLIIYKGLDDKSQKHPITCMLYLGMLGLGFSLIENINYISKFGFEVLQYRTFGAVFVHMICGLLLGYWIGVSKIKKLKLKIKSTASIYLSSRPKLKSLLYISMGLITSICFHALWNYNILTFVHYSTPIAVLMLMVGFLTCKFLFKDLVNQYDKSKKINPLSSRVDTDLDKN